ncbi:MAG TPA: diphthine--ammonia ligase [Chryseosolibacter sp.]
MKKNISVSWSGGKDSAFALYKVLQDANYRVVELHTVFNAETRRVGMHGVHEELIDKQARALGFPLMKLYLNASETHDEYTNLMTDYYRTCRENAIDSVMFGDIFLQDLKDFRDKLLADSGLAGVYPLWRMESHALIFEFIDKGFKTLICSANAHLLDRDVMGGTIDKRFIESLPSAVDPCGENGEFHTFVYGGPMFREVIVVKKGDVISRDYTYKYLNEAGESVEEKTPFWFLDLKTF